MNLSDRDLENLLRDACGPVAPPAGLRGRVLRAASARRAAGRALVRFLVPYAAGVLTVLCVDRAVSPPLAPAPPTASIRLDSIADRPPLPAAAAAPVAAPAPDAPDSVSAPVPRIS